MQDAFSRQHPAVAALYFILVLSFTVCIQHPAALLISVLCAAAYRRQLSPQQSLWYLLPLMLLAAAVNPLFSHAGRTILAYFPSGNPLTLESIVFGAAAAVLIGAAMLWCGCLSAVLSAEKCVVLLGRAAPALGLLLAIALQFLPRCRRYLAQAAEVQRAQAAPSHSRFGALRQALSLTGGLVTWTLESAVETADSMHARGYGLPHRTAYSPYRITRYDVFLLLWLSALGIALTAGIVLHAIPWRYYPTLQGAFTLPCALWLAGYAVLCLTPMIWNKREALRWTPSPFNM